MCRDHHQPYELFQDINWIHDEKYHPCPRRVVLSSATLLPSLQHKLVRVLCYTLRSLLSSICSSLPWNVTTFYVKNVVVILPPLENSWYSNISQLLRSFLGLRVVSNRNTDKWSVMCKFYTSSNPIALKLLVYSSILRLWLNESSFEHWSCYLAHISGAHFNQCLIVYVFLEHTSLYHLIWLMISPCWHNCGNPSFWKSWWIVAETISHPSFCPWFNDELLFQNSLQ